MGAIVVMFSLVAAHTWLDLETVAQLASGASEVAESLSDNTVSGVVTLSTCNRLELYAEAGDNDVDQAAQDVLEVIASDAGLPYNTVANAFRLYRNEAAVRHLFEVSYVIKSAVIWYRDIAEQVRRSLSVTRETGHASVTNYKIYALTYR